MNFADLRQLLGLDLARAVEYGRFALELIGAVVTGGFVGAVLKVWS